MSTRWTAGTVDIAAKTSHPFARPPFGVERGVDTRVQTIHNGVDQLIVEGHGYAWVVARGLIRGANGVRLPVEMIDGVRVELTLTGVELPGPVVAAVDLIRAHPTQSGWTPPPVGYWRTAREPVD